MWVFGCPIWIHPNGIRKRRFKDDVRERIFLGYVPHKDWLILYYDYESERV